ncbi:MAG: hypothetical protein NUV46_03175 [Nanoarchaeota archaeon]|nr:hypothetical protein [Nanoarchaeota archaeon]
MISKNKLLWEILVPKCSNSGEKFDVTFHKKWDMEVEKVSGGLTILRTAKGRWINPDKKFFVEEMIPVRIYCQEKDIEKIMKFTLKYYNQESVFCYLVSEKVKIFRRKKK